MTGNSTTLEDMATQTMLSHYSRILPDGTMENWPTIQARVFDMHRKRLKQIDKDTNDQLMSLVNDTQDMAAEKLIFPSGRSLQFAGKILSKHARIYNCTASICDRPRMFQEAFWLLLCGCGTGINVLKQHVAKLPGLLQMTKQERSVLPLKIFQIDDSIEGWADSMGVLLTTFFASTDTDFPEYLQHDVVFDYSNIRHKGAEISGGLVGKAPGPEPLRKSIENVKALLIQKVENGQYKLSPTDCFDIIGHIADAVLSAGCRRSACLLLGSPDDDEFLGSKTGNWWQTNLQRSRANISALVNRNKLKLEDVAKYTNMARQFGEPGLIMNDGDENFIVNPCLPDTAMITTSTGLFSLKDLIGKPFDALVDGVSYHCKTGFVKTGHRELLKLTTVNGYVLRATDNHKVMKADGQWVEMGKLQPGDVVRIHNHHKAIKIDKTSITYNIGIAAGRVVNIGTDDSLDDFKESVNYFAGFLHGWSLEHAKHQENGTIIFTGIADVRVAQRLLLRIGIFSSTVNVNQLIISSGQSNLFNSIVCNDNNIEADTAIFSSQISKITVVAGGPVDVYDCTVDDVHAFDADGFYVHNCAEIGLLPILHDDDKKFVKADAHTTGWQFCNLSEVAVANCYAKNANMNIPAIKTMLDEALMSIDHVVDIDFGRQIFLQATIAAVITGELQSTYTDFKYLGNVSELITRREALLGVSQTTIFDLPDAVNTHLQPDFQKLAAQVARYTANKVAAMLGINSPARITTIKPSGTATVVLGKTGSGIHLPHAKQYIRHVQATTNDPLVKYYKQHRPKSIEIYAGSGDAVVIAYPIKIDTNNTKINTSCLELLDHALNVQQNWVVPGRDVNRCRSVGIMHNVSLTLNVADDEWDSITQKIFDNRDKITGITLLASSGDVVYRQAPFVRAKTANELVTDYGDACMFASGLIVDVKKAFGNHATSLHDAIDKIKYPSSDVTGNDNDDDSNQQMKNNFMKLAIFRIKKFSNNFFSGDIERCIICLLDIDVSHKFIRISREANNNPVNWDLLKLDTPDDVTQRKAVQAELNSEPNCSGGVCYMRKL